METKPRKRYCTKYTPRLAMRICEHIAMGASLKQALEKEPLAPGVVTFWKWLDEQPLLRETYERARVLQADLASDNVLEMAAAVLDKPRFAAAYKVAADILRWQAEVKNPARYGQKVQIAQTAQLDPVRMKAEIIQLERELGLLEQEVRTIDIEAIEVASPLQKDPV